MIKDGIDGVLIDDSDPSIFGAPDDRHMTIQFPINIVRICKGDRAD